MTNLKASDVPAANTLASTLAGLSDFAKVIGAEVSDTASNIAKNLTDLSTNKLADGSLLVSKISVSDKAPMTLTYDQLTTSALTNVLSLISNPYSIKMDSKSVVGIANAVTVTAPNKNATILPFAITDTADNISANLADLIKLVSAKTVSQINVSSSASAIKLTKDQLSKAASVLPLLKGSYGIGLLNLTASDALSLAKTPKLQSVTIKDSLTNLTASLSSLTSILSKVSTIALTDASVDKTKLDTLKAALAKANPAIVVQDAKGTTL